MRRSAETLPERDVSRLFKCLSQLREMYWAEEFGVGELEEGQETLRCLTVQGKEFLVRQLLDLPANSCYVWDEIASSSRT